MPRERVTTKTVYTFDELTDQAKEQAREWMRECESEDFDPEFVLDDAAEICKILGISLRQRSVPLHGGGTRSKPVIYYSGFSSQGDGACFEGTYSYAKQSTQKIREHAPVDKTLHRIADTLAETQRKHFYRLQAAINHRGHYYHSRSVSIEVEDANDTYRDLGSDADTIAEALRDLMDWIYKQLMAEYDYRLSNEAIDETIKANEYEFDENGRPA